MYSVNITTTNKSLLVSHGHNFWSGNYIITYSAIVHTLQCSRMFEIMPSTKSYVIQSRMNTYA